MFTSTGMTQELSRYAYLTGRRCSPRIMQSILLLLLRFMVSYGDMDRLLLKNSIRGHRLPSDDANHCLHHRLHHRYPACVCLIKNPFGREPSFFLFFGRMGPIVLSHSGKDEDYFCGNKFSIILLASDPFSFECPL